MLTSNQELLKVAMHEMCSQKRSTPEKKEFIRITKEAKRLPIDLLKTLNLEVGTIKDRIWRSQVQKPVNKQPEIWPRVEK